MKILVVGADSRLSKILCPVLFEKGHNVIKTSRRDSKDNIFLDLKDVSNFVVPNNIDAAVIVGGVTSYAECKNNYKYAYEINCKSIPLLTEKFFEKKIRVCFISTNTVFEFNQGVPKETDRLCPGFDYANLKAETETALKKISMKKNCTNLLSILRLTKNVSYETPPFDDWIKKIKAKKEFFAFKDLYFAPIRFLDSANSVEKIINKKAFGIFHLSGEKDISYSDFAIELLKYLNLNKNLVKSVKSTDIGVNLIYNHHITSLNMEATTKAINLKPINLVTVYSYFKKALLNN